MAALVSRSTSTFGFAAAGAGSAAVSCGVCAFSGAATSAWAGRSFSSYEGGAWEEAHELWQGRASALVGRRVSFIVIVVGIEIVRW